MPADLVPATFKKKKATIAPRAKGEEGDEKPGRPEENTRTTGLGRGTRAWESWISFVLDFAEIIDYLRKVNSVK